MKICHLIATLPLSLKPQVNPQDLLIAVDGGYAHCLSAELCPDLVLGDFDSLGYVPQVEHRQVLSVRKDETDMEYALKQAQSQGYTRFLLQGGLGGRHDHSFANIQLLLRLAKQGQRGILMGDNQVATVLSPGEITFPQGFTGEFSVFALEGDATGVCLENLSFPGEEISLSPVIPLGVSNAFLPEKSATVRLAQGNLLLFWNLQGSYQDYVALLCQ